MTFHLGLTCTNNQAEYEALFIGFEILKHLNAHSVDIMGDSQLVVRQLLGEYTCQNIHMAQWCASIWCLLNLFSDWTIKDIPRDQNN